jgi:hypothetical protein
MRPQVSSAISSWPDLSGARHPDNTSQTASEKKVQRTAGFSPIIPREGIWVCIHLNAKTGILSSLGEEPKSQR